LETKQQRDAYEAGGPEAVIALEEMRKSYEEPSLDPNLEDNEAYQTAKGKYDAAVKKKQDIMAVYMQKRGYKRFEKTFLGKPQGKFTYEDAGGRPAPQKLVQEAEQYANEVLEPKSKLPNDNSFDTAEMQKLKRQADLGAPTPVGDVPKSMELQQKQKENIDQRITQGTLRRADVATQVNNTTLNKQVDKTIPIKREVPPVRMPEPEFRNRINSNTVPAN
jgi:hypothetical protein